MAGITTLNWYDDSFQPVSVGDGTGAVARDYVFFGGKRIGFTSLNTYVMNNPANTTDPFGLTDCPQGKTCAPPTLSGFANPLNGCQVWDAGCGLPFGTQLLGFRDPFGDPLVDAEQQYDAMVAAAFAQAIAGRNANPSELHLNLESDCVSKNGQRNLVYSLDDPHGNTVSGFYVTEHQTDMSLTPNHGPEGPGTTSQGPNPNGLSGFNDSIWGIGFHDSKQTFTVSRNKPGRGGPNYPTFVRNPGGDYGTLGIYIKNGVAYVNGDASEPVCH